MGGLIGNQPRKKGLTFKQRRAVKLATGRLREDGPCP
jgi:hypothetical protein